MNMKDKKSLIMQKVNSRVQELGDIEHEEQEPTRKLIVAEKESIEQWWEHECAELQEQLKKKMDNYAKSFIGSQLVVVEVMEETGYRRTDMNHRISFKFNHTSPGRLSDSKDLLGWLLRHKESSDDKLNKIIEISLEVLAGDDSRVKEMINL